MNCRIVMRIAPGAFEEYVHEVAPGAEVIRIGGGTTIVWCETHNQKVLIGARCPVGEAEHSVRKGLNQLRRELKRRRQ